MVANNSFFDWAASLTRFVKRDTARAEEINDALDSISNGFTATEALTNAAIKLPAGETSTALGNAAARKGKVLTFNAVTGAAEASIAAVDVATVAANIVNVNTASGISANVTTVAGIAANVTTVAGNNANVSTVAGISAAVTTVAGITGNIAAVVADEVDIGIVAAANVAIGTVSANVASVNTAATNIAAIIAAPTQAGIATDKAALTAADAEQTALYRAQTGQDRTQTGLDAAATANDVQTSAAAAQTATTKAAEALASANAAAAVTGIPLVAGNAFKVLRVNAAADGMEWSVLSTISLAGNLSPYVTQTTTLTITNFDSETAYSVAATGGAASIAGDTITYGAGSVAGAYHLDITAGAAMRSVAVTVQAAAVAAPTITSPASGATGITETPTIATGAFSAIGVADTHAATDWELWTSANRTGTLVWSSANDTANKLSITIPAGLLTVATAYYPAVRHKGTTLGYGAWTVSSFTTAATFNSYIATPTATPASFGDAFEGGFYTGMIWNELAQTATSTLIGTGSKTFTVADMTGAPLVYAGQTMEVRSRANPANKMIGVVTGALGTSLTINVTSVGGSGTFTDWSIMARYRVIVAPKSSGENAAVAYKNVNTAAPTACGTLSEGYKATMAMVAADTSTVYPAAWWCKNLSIAGKTDWYLPARDELELAWRNLKPTADANYVTADRPTTATPNYMNLGAYGDTAATHGLDNNSSPAGVAHTSGVPAQVAAGKNFRTGEAEAFVYGSAYYWSASEYSATYAWFQYWHSSFPGYQANYSKTDAYVVRAVRRSII